MAFLAPRLRTADIRELAARNESPVKALCDGLEVSLAPFTITRRARPLAMFGCVHIEVTPHLAYGSIWLLGSEELLDIRMQFLRESRRWLDVVSQGCQLTGNVVHSENIVHVRWIKWLGYSFLRRLVVGGQPFLEFAKIHVRSSSYRHHDRGRHIG